MTLLSVQKSFRDHILANADALLPSIAPPRAYGLAVYRHAYRAQLIACLRDTFDKTWSWLGDEAFDHAASFYVEATPPSTWTLNEYGSRFSETLRQLYPNDPEVSELAWLDWSLRRAFDGPDVCAAAIENFARVDWDRAVIHFLPTLSVGTVETNVAALWSTLSDSETPPPAQRLQQPGAVRIWRSGLSPKFRSIEAFEYQALVLAMAGSSFGDLCSLLVEHGDQDAAAQRVGTLLARWIQDELIVSVRPAS